MAAKLIVDFVGLMALVCVPGSQRAVTVVALNGDYSRPDTDASLDVGCHQARLTMDASVLCMERADGSLPPGCRGTSTPPIAYYPQPGGGRLAIWDIDHRDVSFKASNGFEESDVRLWDKEVASKDEHPGTALTRWLAPKVAWRDSGWTANLYRASDKGVVAKHHLTLPHDPDKSPTLALIRLERGVLATVRPDDVLLRKNVFEFATSAGVDVSHTKAIGDRVRFEAHVRESLAIVIRSRGGRKRTIHLRPNEKGEIPIAFGNLPLKDPGHTPGVIKHFKAFYNLLKDAPSCIRVPHLRVKGASTSAGTQSCPAAGSSSLPAPAKASTHAHGTTSAVNHLMVTTAKTALGYSKAAISSSDCPPAFALAEE